MRPLFKSGPKNWEKLTGNFFETQIESKNQNILEIIYLIIR